VQQRIDASGFTADSRIVKLPLQRDEVFHEIGRRSHRFDFRRLQWALAETVDGECFEAFG
jgi:hypothetical protein